MASKNLFTFPGNGAANAMRDGVIVITDNTQELLAAANYASMRALLGVSAKRIIAATIFHPLVDVSLITGGFYYRVPSLLNGKDITAVHAQVVTAGTTGALTVQVTRIRSGTPVSVLSTALSIDSGTTASHQAATPAVIDLTKDDLATNDLLRVDVNGVPTTKPKGLMLTIEVGTD